MNAKELCSMVDHTLLKQTATWPEIQNLCDEAIAYGTASVCIPPCYVAQAHQYVQGKMTICTVVGFPNGNTTPASKEFETREALANGAEEIDMVINIGMLKAGDLSYVADEIRRLKAAVGDKVLKVIIETCLLTDEEKIAMCRHRRGFHQNIHRLFYRRCDVCRYRAFCQACGAGRKDQGRGRHFHAGGCGALRGAGRQPPGHQPDYQAA